MNIVSKLAEFLSQHDAIDKPLILAVSGGADSMAMLFCCYQLKLNVIVAHCNFKLRADDSDLDQKLVSDFCKKNKMIFKHKSFLTQKIVTQQKISIQETARNLRYQWFEELRIKHQAGFVLTAHHGNDLLETFIFNACRGAGLNGLTSIPQKNGYILRPWLKVSKQHIHNYINENNIPFRDDVSNFKDEYKRNYIRQHIVPLLSNVNSAAEQHSIDAIFNLKESADIVNEKLEELKQKYTHFSNNKFTINLNACLKKSYAKQLLVSWLMPYGFNSIIIESLLSSKLKTGNKWFSASYQLTYSRGKVIITALAIKADSQIHITTLNPTKINWQNTVIDIDFVSVAPYHYKPNTLYLAVTKSDLPFTIRNWEIGDKFMPLGMKGFKKVSDFFIDNKIDATSKTEVAVLCNSSNILAIIPFRVDNRFKVLPQSKTIMVVSIKN